MNKILVMLVFITSFQCFSQNSSWENDRINRGEVLNYNIKYGWFKIGKAEVFHDPEFHLIDGEPHYYVQFTLRTVGWLKIFANLNLCFDSYINAKTYQPNRSTRLTINGKRINNQFDEFQYQDSIYVKTFREDRDQLTRHSFEVNQIAFLDALSTYIYMRAQELDMRKDENVKFYIANRVYDFRITPNKKLGKGEKKSYEMKFPPIKQFPKNKTSYVFFNSRNVPKEIKLGTNDGNFYLILNE